MGWGGEGGLCPGGWGLWGGPWAVGIFYTRPSPDGPDHSSGRRWEGCSAGKERGILDKPRPSQSRNSSRAVGGGEEGAPVHKASIKAGWVEADDCLIKSLELPAAQICLPGFQRPSSHGGSWSF